MAGAGGVMVAGGGGWLAGSGGAMVVWQAVVGN